MGRNTPDRGKIAQTACRQHGNITRVQLLALGFTSKELEAMLAAGYLHRVYWGVYAVGRPPVVPLEWAAAAVLACGPHAALSHHSALALWELRKQWPKRLEVIVTTGDRRQKGITVHRCRTLARRDLTTQRGIRTTSPARTLLDCAPDLKNVARIVNAARHARLTNPAQLAGSSAAIPPTQAAKPSCRSSAAAAAPPARTSKTCSESSAAATACRSRCSTRS